jgi:peptidoglycan/LPS O-acetylase OafA/YrhL
VTAAGCQPDAAARSSGVDALRVPAAFAVVLIHTPDRLADGWAAAVRGLLPNPTRCSPWSPAS